MFGRRKWSWQIDEIVSDLIVTDILRFCVWGLGLGVVRDLGL